MNPVLVAALGVAWGLVSDRIAARWPAHHDGHVRAVDWRTGVVAVAGGLAGYLLATRFGDATTWFLFLGAVVVVLVLAFATDLDQRLLPDVLTLPIIPYALLGFVIGWGPFVRTPEHLLWAVVAAVALPGVLFALSIPFGAGAIGMGDLKLLFGLGLLMGAYRLVATVVLGAIAAAIGIVILIVARRITLKSYVPYGPFLILGAMLAIVQVRG